MPLNAEITQPKLNENVEEEKKRKIICFCNVHKFVKFEERMKTNFVLFSPFTFPRRLNAHQQLAQTDTHHVLSISFFLWFFLSF